MWQKGGPQVTPGKQESRAFRPLTSQSRHRRGKEDLDPRAMPTLSSSIVKHNLASVRDVEEALARQAMYGGDLVTNLLELSAVSEAELARLLAESYEVT